MEKLINKIIQGDCLEILQTLPVAKMIFADPPDNLGLKYDGYVDKRDFYLTWLGSIIHLGIVRSRIFWISYYYRYQRAVMNQCQDQANWRQFIWRFTFGQHRTTDCGNGYRPIMRIICGDAKIYPDAIRVPSARLLKYKDKRANPAGRVPDDVWEFPRVCGTFNERRKWHPNQHPEALIERIVKLSCKKGDLVIDMFAGTGTVNRVCKRLGIDCIGIEISDKYCKEIHKELS